MKDADGNIVIPYEPSIDSEDFEDSQLVESTDSEPEAQAEPAIIVSQDVAVEPQQQSIFKV